MSKTEKLLKNKSIIIVGPAGYLQNSNKREFIENHDVVVRLNSNYTIPPEHHKDIGTKTDLLYHCFWAPIFPEIELLVKNVSLVKAAFPTIPPFNTDIARFVNINRNRVDFEFYDPQKYSELVKRVNSRPNTGTSAIYDILSYDIKSLHVSGITMFAGGYIKNYRKNWILYSREEAEQLNNVHKNHDIGRQIKLLKSLFADERVTLDPEVRESIYEL
jgi:hypothetical protein